MALILSLVDRLVALLEPVRTTERVVFMIGYENWWVVDIEPAEADL